MLLDDRPYTFDRVFRLGVTIAGLLFLIWVARQLAPVLIPFVIAALSAYLLNPLVNLVQRRIPHRVAAVLTTLGGVGLLALGAGYVLIRILIGEAIQLTSLLARLAREQEVPATIAAWLPDNWWEQLRLHLADWSDLEQLAMNEQLWSTVQELAPLPLNVLGWAGGLALSLIGLSVIAMYLVFLLIDYDWFRRNWSALLPEQHRGLVASWLTEFDQAMRTHFRAQAVIATTVGILSALGFSLVGLPLAVLFGLFVGLLNMVPYLQLASIPLAALLALLQVLQGDAGFAWAFGGVLIVYLVVQVIQDAILTPRIMGEAFGLRPVVVLLAVMLWGQVLGFLGLVIALPMTCLGYAWYQRYLLGQPTDSPPQPT